MAAEGLPLGRRERGADHDILAGADFLSVFIESSLRRAYSETTTAASITFLDLEDENLQVDPSNYIRTQRGTSPFAQTSTENESEYDTTIVSDRKIDISDTSNNNNKNNAVVAVRVSSSVGRTINKELHEPFRDRISETNTLSVTLTEPPTTELLYQTFISSEEHPSIIAQASKSELSVEEREPITKDSDLDSSDYIQSYPASVRALPSQSHSSFDPTSSFLSQELNKNPKQPFHQTVIYHDNPREPGRARSVSYSTVIQHPHLQTEMEKDSQQHERHERNYNGARSSFINNFEMIEERRKTNDSKPFSSIAETKNTYVTNIPFTSSSKTWEGIGKPKKKPYSPPPQRSPPLPKVYGQPEQNYEVDEAVHKKLKLRTLIKKEDQDQKVGYVVEGRNYRKYRVEERTADGFIVGEYGVVSHDDGSLRGVRYTADGTINPRLIYDALMKFLSL
ncbi:hypothetical protein NQ314_011225 [Rhamnusium bicolor]|uniref:Uncharacterized protein n=1 Tax=Rhamnusium bicolor TaxID=1586634 RepID=A0AAV8XKY6_9CUCU|nr:hypothetical protein NQ314_011225 [Rhamnusium bicolor]